MKPSDREPIVEDVIESLTTGDDEPTYRRGTARAAMRHPEFRIMWLGSFGSNIGSWMQQVVLGSYAYQLTGSASFVALVVLVQLGPLLLLSLPGGVIADLVDRRRLLIALQAEQLVFSLLLGVLVAGGGDPNRVALLACVLAIGVGNALNAPAWSAVLPALVGKEDLPGAISMNSFMVNGSRVVGPAIAGVLYPVLGPAWIFVLNAATYLFVIAALFVIRLPDVPRSLERGWDRLAAGFRVARDVPTVGRILTVLPLFSVFCLPFISLFAPLAEIDLGLNSKTLAYGILYACFGFGAALGALSVGTVFADRDKRVLVRWGLVGFAVMLFVFGALRHPAPAYPAVFGLGFVYFGTTTSMMTVLQQTLDDRVRGRVMALWFMGFGGAVPFGGLIFSAVLDATNGTVVLGIGAVVALALAWWCDLVRLEAREAGA